jgi:hypothetical protein
LRGSDDAVLSERGRLDFPVVVSLARPILKFTIARTANSLNLAGSNGEDARFRDHLFDFRSRERLAARVASP